MAVILGSLLTSASGGTVTPQLADELNMFDGPEWPKHQSIAGDILDGVVTLALPVEANPRAISGSVLPSYFQDYYFRIHANPSSLDLGNLLSSQSRTISFWNAFLVPVNVTSVGLDVPEGMGVVPPVGYETTPFNLPALTEITYTLSVSLDGPPNINASLIFASDEGTYSIPITGSRVTLFSFLPDWGPGLDETLSARSSVYRAPDGTEQSVSMRRRFRRSFSIPYTVKDVDAQLFENLLFGWQSRLYGLPIWPEQSYLSAPIVNGTTAFEADISDRTFVPNGLVMVFSGKDHTNGEVREILSLTSSGGSVKVPFDKSWPAGARIVPVALAAAEPQVQGVRHVPTVMQIAVSFDCEPSATDPNMPEATAPALYRGYELYLKRTNWRSSLPVNSVSDVNRIDFQGGTFKLRSSSGFSSIGRSHVFTFKTLAEIADFRAWIRRRLGKAVGVWMPSGAEDFTPAGVITSANLDFLVKTNGYAALVAQNESRRDIFIKLRNGQYFCRRITDSLDLGDGTTRLSIDQNLGITVNPEDVYQFSLLSFYRLASDDVTLHWYVPGVIESTVGLTTTKALQ